MLNEKEIMLVRGHVADFCVNFIDVVCSGNTQDAKMAMEIFSNFICSALMAAKRDGRRDALITTTN